MTRLRGALLLALAVVLWLPVNLFGRGAAITPLVMWGVRGTFGGG